MVGFDSLMHMSKGTHATQFAWERISESSSVLKLTVRSGSLMSVYISTMHGAKPFCVWPPVKWVRRSKWNIGMGSSPAGFHGCISSQVNTLYRLLLRPCLQHLNIWTTLKMLRTFK